MNNPPPPYNPNQEQEPFIPRDSVYQSPINQSPSTPYPPNNGPYPSYSDKGTELPGYSQSQQPPPQAYYYGQPQPTNYYSPNQPTTPYYPSSSNKGYPDGNTTYYGGGQAPSSSGGEVPYSHGDYNSKSYGTSPSNPEPYQYDNNVITSDFVYNCSKEIKMAFIRKVYIILFCQIALTMAVGALFMYVEDVKNWVQKNYWMIWVNLIPTLLVLFALIWKRKQAPVNFILLVLFTLLEGYSIGVIVTYYDEIIVLEALIVTVAIFLGLTLFTFQTKFDFSGCGPVLVAGLIGLLVMGLLQIFIRNEVLEIVYCSIGIIIFSGLILYDTQNIIKRTCPDEYIMASVNLYLDVLNLFLFVLRLFGRRG